MGTLSTELLRKRFTADSFTVLEIADEQVRRLTDGENIEAIKIGDYWLPRYSHVPHSILFDAFSAQAEHVLCRPHNVVLRLLRADVAFRHWERSVEAGSIDLTEGERINVGCMLADFTESLSWIRSKEGPSGFMRLLLDEYQQRLLSGDY